MVTFTSTLTDTENMAMEWCAVSAKDWIDNALHNLSLIHI